MKYFTPKKSKIIILLGILTALMPFLGFSGSVRDTIIVVFSLVVAVSGFVYLIEERRLKDDEKKEAFVDNGYQFTEGNKQEDDNPNSNIKINISGNEKGGSVNLEIKE